MLQNFENIFPKLSSNSRIWLYLGHRKLDLTELKFAEEQLQSFLKTWTAHGKNLLCDGTIFFSQYLVLAADEVQESASGCSIDTSVRFVKSLGEDLKIDFFNRMNVLEIIGEQTQISKFFEVVQHKKKHFNPLIQKLEELRSSWVVF